MLNTPSVWNIRIVFLFVLQFVIPYWHCVHGLHGLFLMIDGKGAVWMLDLHFSLECV